MYLEWIDAASPADDISWWSEKEIIDWSAKFDSHIKSVGWIIQENKKFIILASEYDQANDCYAHPLRVPKPWIRRRVDLTKIIK